MRFPVLGVPLRFYPKGTPVKLDDCKPNLVKVALGIPYMGLGHLGSSMSCPREMANPASCSYSLTLISKAFSDGVLIRVGHAFRQCAKVRLDGPMPFKLPSAELSHVQQAAAEI